jgi:hypothetical protein
MRNREDVEKMNKRGGFREFLKQKNAEKGTRGQGLGEMVVHVPQGEAALLPRNLAERYRYIATRALGPCVGVVVVGTESVGLAHIDSDSQNIAAQLALFAINTIRNPTKIIIASGTRLPQPGDGGDRSSTRIYQGLVETFGSARTITLNVSDIAYDLQSDREIESPQYNTVERAPGIPYWRITRVPPDLLQPLAP